MLVEPTIHNLYHAWHPLSPRLTEALEPSPPGQNARQKDSISHPNDHPSVNQSARVIFHSRAHPPLLSRQTIRRSCRPKSRTQVGQRPSNYTAAWVENFRSIRKFSDDFSFVVIYHAWGNYQSVLESRRILGQTMAVEIIVRW